MTGIFAAGADGRPEALTPVFETPEALLADYADRGKTLCANRYGFGQRIWQSRVETDRIVMEGTARGGRPAAGSAKGVGF